MAFFGCTSAERGQQRAMPALPDFPPVANLSDYTMDSVHRYGAGDCFGTIRRYTGAETIVIDSMSCSEYSFRFIWYWLDASGRVYQAQEATWQSLLNSTWDDYDHIYSESVHLAAGSDSLLTFSRIDTLESHYLLLGPYPGSINKEFKPAQSYNLDSVLVQTWNRN